MKLQCSCGAKSSFEVTPDMANQPVHFSCPSCGIDYSEFVTNLVRQELGPAVAPAIAPPPSRAIVPPPPGMATGPPPSASPAVAPIGSVRVPALAPAPTPSTAIAPPPAVALSNGPAVAAPAQPAIAIPRIPAVAPAPTPAVAIPAQPVQAIAPAPVAIAPPPQPAVAPAPRPVARIVSHSAPVSAAPPPGQAAPASGLRINKETPAVQGATATEVADPDAPKPCFRHMGQFAVEKCYVCSKPICPKCMELFGYVCSPLCKSKAEAQGIEVPEFEGQRDVKEARTWRKTVLVTTSVCSVIAVVVGFWFWYAWFGSAPHTVFSVRFGDRAHSGQSAFAAQDQIVFLHGGTLARHDMKHKKEIWSVNLIDDKEIDRLVAKEMEEAKKEIDRANSE